MEQFLTNATVATSATELWDAFIRQMEAHGIDRFGYVQFVPGSITPALARGRFFGFPEGWIDRYLASYGEADPVRSLVAIHPTPFRWHEMETLRSLSPEEIAFRDDVERYDANERLIVPVFGAASRNGYVIFILPQEFDFSPLHVAKFRVVCQYMHQRFCELVPPGSATPGLLSKREREVLRWVARGKSNSVIADILGVSINTVDTHLRRIYQKLNVSDRVSAALAGLAKGVITLD